MGPHGNFSELIILLVLIFIGFAVEKFKLLSREDIDVIPRFLFQVAYPALIIVSVSKINPAELIKNSVYVVVLTLAITLCIYFIALLVLRRYQNKSRREIILFQLMISNVTFVGLPIIKTLFGEIGVYYAIVFAFSQDIILWSLCYWYFSCTEYTAKDTLKHMVNPCMIALVAGLIIIGFSLELPYYASRPLEMLSQTALPLALIFMGSIFNRGGAKQWLPERDVVLLVIAKVILLPLVVYIILYFTPLDRALVFLIAMLIGLPFPLLSAVFAKQFDKDYVFALKGILFSTALSLVVFVVLFVFYLDVISGFFP
jgi:predicted permease